MTNAEFTNFASAKGLRCAGSCAYGKIAGYPITVTLNGKQLQVLFALHPDDIAKLKAPIKKALKGIGAYQFLADGFLAVNMAGNLNALEQKYTGMTGAMQTVLRDSMVRPAENCPFCKAGNCDSLAHYGTGYRPVHKACMNNAYQNVKEEAEKNDLQGNYFLGILGGILGGIIACIPSILTIWFMERIYGLLYALIPLGIYYGYKLCKGKLNKVAVAVTIVLSVVLALSIDVIIVVMSFVSEGIPLEWMFLALSDSEMISALAVENIKSLLFVALGIWIAWAQISKTAKTPVIGMEASLETLTPMEPAGAVPGYAAATSEPVQYRDPGEL